MTIRGRGLVGLSPSGGAADGTTSHYADNGGSGTSIALAYRVAEYAANHRAKQRAAWVRAVAYYHRLVDAFLMMLWKSLSLSLTSTKSIAYRLTARGGTAGQKSASRLIATLASRG